MPLHDIIELSVARNTVLGVTVQSKAVHAAVPLIRADDQATIEALYVAAARLVHVRCTRAMRSVGRKQKQGSFFMLRERYAIDIDNRVVKDTELLTRLEWRRCIQIREDQIEADRAHLDQMKAADAQLSLVWDEYPDKRFGEIEAIYLRRRLEAVAA